MCNPMGRYWFLATVFSLLSQVRKKAAWVEISVCRGLLVMPHPFSPVSYSKYSKMPSVLSKKASGQILSEIRSCKLKTNSTAY